MLREMLTKIPRVVESSVILFYRGRHIQHAYNYSSVYMDCRHQHRCYVSLREE